MNKRTLKILTDAIDKLCESLDFEVELFLTERPYLLELRGESVQKLENLELKKWENRVKTNQLIMEVEKIINNLSLDK